MRHLERILCTQRKELPHKCKKEITIVYPPYEQFTDCLNILDHSVVKLETLPMLVVTFDRKFSKENKQMVDLEKCIFSK